MTVKRDFNRPIYSQSKLWNALINLYIYNSLPEETPENRQAAKDHLRAVIQSGVDVNELGYKTGDYFYSPLSFALLVMNDIGVGQDLLTHGADIDFIDAYGNTMANNVMIYMRPLVVLDFLVDRGADLSIKDHYGMDVAAHLEQFITTSAASPREDLRAFNKAYAHQARATIERAAAQKPRNPGPPKP